MLFCSIDSEAPGRQYPHLRADKKLLGLPSIVFLDAEGAVLVQVPVAARSVAGFGAALQRAETYARLRAAAAAAGDGDAAARFLLMQLEERQVDLAAARERRRGLDAKLDGGLLAELDLRILDLDVEAAVHEAGQDGRHRLGPRFLAMLRQGPHPSPRVTRGYWFAMLEWAERQRDAVAFAEALAGMRAALAISDPDATWVPGLLQRYEVQLAALRQAR